MDRVLVTEDGAELRYAVTGSGVPLLLRSGGPGCSDYLGEIAAGLADIATVVRMDPRGCGDSTADGRYDHATVVADLEALRTALGFERWIVGGHSNGAWQALAYAMTYPARTLGVAYMAGTGLQRDRSWSEAYHAGLDAGLGREVPEGYYRVNLEVNRVGNASYAVFVTRPTLWRDVATLRVPFFAIAAGEDIRPNWPVEQLVALLPEASLAVIEGAPHDHWYTHPTETIALLRGFVGSMT
jgi:proline iminopeptidase